MAWNETFSAALLLFLVMDPLGNVPVFLTCLQSVAPERRRRVLLRELLVALVALLLFVGFGGTLLSALGIRTESLRVAGGLILFIIALRMIFPDPSRNTADDLDGEPFIVPLAIPLVAGPSAFATLLLLGQAEGATMSSIVTALLLAWAASSVILLASERIGKIMGRRGLIAVERLMGLLLVALAVQMLMDGLITVLGSK